MTDAPTMAERYQRATGSSRLVVEERTRGDVDLLIAAGWTAASLDENGDPMPPTDAKRRSALSVALYRLAAEYDSVKGEKRLYEAECVRLQNALDRANAQLDEERRRNGSRVGFLAEQVALMENEVARYPVTAHLLILSHLKSLAETKRLLGEFAQIMATKWIFMRPNATVDVVTGRVLDVWLDPSCRKCTGLGFTGGYGSPQVVCRPCKGTGKRRDQVGQDPEERLFAARLFADMDRMLSDVDGAMRRFLRGGA